MSNTEEIKRKYQEFQTACKTTLPKVDALLIRGPSYPSTAKS